FDQRKFQLAVAIIRVILSVILLVGVITSLHFAESANVRLGMISGFAALFALSVRLLTNTKRGDMHAATAAYAAVLVVFISGNLGDCKCTLD
ncbi:hypothetical protein K469DRAFT_601631, partial [Zopfia rhizophila CBS 207.26]